MPIIQRPRTVLKTSKRLPITPRSNLLPHSLSIVLRIIRKLDSRVGECVGVMPVEIWLARGGELRVGDRVGRLEVLAAADLAVVVCFQEGEGAVVGDAAGDVDDFVGREAGIESWDGGDEEGEGEEQV